MEVKKGYKQTEVGVIPEDWESKPLRGLVSIIHGFGFDGDYFKDTGTYRLTTPGNFHENGGFRDVGEKQKYYDGYVPDGYVLSKDTIIIAMTEQSEGLLGSAAVIPVDGVYLHNQRLGKLESIRRDICDRFLYRVFNSPYYRTKLRETAAGTKVKHTSPTKLLEIPIPLPPTLAEQEAIAGALSDADAWIESLEQLIAKKRQIKQGAMQELLTGERRLPGFSGKWQTKRLGDLGSTYGGLTGKTKTDFGAGGAMYVTFMNVMSNVVIDCTTFERVNVVASESQNRVVKNDILFNGSSETPEEVAMCALVDTDVTDVYLNSFCFGFRFREDVTVDGRFLAYYLRSNVGREIMKSLAQGSTRYNLSKTALLRAVLQLPSPHEQTAIATVLSDMYAEIESLESKLAKARDVKQGMMQELLTGRIRLV